MNVRKTDTEMGGGAADASAPADPAPEVETPRRVDVTNDEVRRVTRMSYGRHLRVLLVAPDDAAADPFLAAAEESVLDVNVEVALGSADAMSRLCRSVTQRLRRSTPDVVVSLLEVEECHQLLAQLRDDSRFDLLPVIVLSDDPSPGLERRSFAFGAAGHLRTPRRDYERVALVHALPDFIPTARAAHLQIESERSAPLL